MSAANAHADGTYSMTDDQDELRAEFDEEFDLDDDDVFQVDSCWCSDGTGSFDICCV